MTRYSILSGVFAVALGVGGAAAQDVASTSGGAQPSARIRITHSVTADGKPLAPGTYEMRLTGERPPLVSGGPSENQRWVEFVSNGTVVAREIAEVFPLSDARAVGTSSASAGPARVQLLKGGEFLRVSVMGPDGRYLVYLPVAGGPVQP